MDSKFRFRCSATGSICSGPPAAAQVRELEGAGWAQRGRDLECGVERVRDLRVARTWVCRSSPSSSASSAMAGAENRMAHRAQIEGKGGEKIEEELTER